MDDRDRGFFRRLINDERMLRSHGFDGWPSDEELVRYACDLEDGLRALADAFGADLARDAAGNWRVLPRGRGAM